MNITHNHNIINIIVLKPKDFRFYIDNGLFNDLVSRIEVFHQMHNSNLSFH